MAYEINFRDIQEGKYLKCGKIIYKIARVYRGDYTTWTTGWELGVNMVMGVDLDNVTNEQGNKIYFDDTVFSLVADPVDIIHMMHAFSEKDKIKLAVLGIYVD